MSYARNAWYLAAWSDELAPRTMLARTILDVPVLLLRGADGEVSALHDRCPHRFAPLSLGRVHDDGVQCGYHGLRFDGGGRCIENPHGPTATVARVRRFSVREAYKAVWIWMGEAEADHTMLPDLSFMDAAPDTAFSKGYLHSRGNYQLYTDNIMDLSHVDYLHPSTIGSGAITRTRPTLEESDLGVSIKWLSMNEALGPLMESVLELNGAPADVWTEVHWSVPSIMRLVHGGVRAGHAREKGINNVNLHAVTPETESTTHYFFAATRSFRLDDAAFNARFAQTRREIFATEDKPMIEAQYDRMDGADFWSLKPGLFSMDRGLVLVRRKLEKLIARESSSGRAGPAPTLSSNA